MPKIYTKTGDNGTTGLLGPGRVAKCDSRVAAYGAVDELSAVIGVAKATSGLSLEADRALSIIQEELFAVGAALADPDPNGAFSQIVTDEHVARLEREIDVIESSLTPLQSFILPGGTLPAAQIHFARTICRRAERETVRVTQEEDEFVSPNILKYLNRLSDFLFVFARQINHEAGVSEIPWKGI